MLLGLEGLQLNEYHIVRPTLGLIVVSYQPQHNHLSATGIWTSKYGIGKIPKCTRKFSKMLQVHD